MALFLNDYFVIHIEPYFSPKSSLKEGREGSPILEIQRYMFKPVKGKVTKI